MDLNHLEKILRVETPPFLFSRIQKKIKDSKKEKMPKFIVVTVGLLFTMLLAVNIFVLTSFSEDTNDMDSMEVYFNLTTNQSLYK
jgi:hypothetical protein